MTEKTPRNQYLNMKLYYKFHLLQAGYEITGSGEKIKEVLSDETQTEFERAKRVTLEIKGRYERNIFGSHKVYLNIVEYGRIRISRTTYILTVKNNKYLVGSFITTAADSTGQTEMTKP